MNLSSVIVIPHPDQIEAVRQGLAELPCVELHAVSPEGKMIITLETDDDRGTVDTYEFVSQMAGVLSASMVFHQQETEPEFEIPVAA